MRLDDYAERDGKRVWLTADEIELVIDEAESPVEEVAFRLAGHAGLRRDELTSVTARDFEHAPDGFVRVWSDYAKRDKYREAPVPEAAATIARTLGHQRDAGEPVVDVVGTTVYRALRRAADRLEDETGDEGWSYLDVHDLRRSWGGHLLWDCGVSAMAVMQFGGWSSWQTFKEHYMGEMSPQAMGRERGKIYDREREPDETALFSPASDAAQATYAGSPNE